MEARIRLASTSDLEQLSQLRCALWPESSAEEDKRNLAAILSGNPAGDMPLDIYVAESEEGAVVGFLEIGLRSHADGCDTRVPVGFIEGWFVSESHRGQAIGAQLMAAAEDWARNHGCVEMASDTWIDNDLSQRVHEALGFEVVDRCVHYRKAL
jgi:aminoglycoside 6'-N-acetyltransferase I